MDKGRYLIAILALTVLISTGYSSQVNEATGPFKISFELPVDKVGADIPDPAFGDGLSMYGLTASADNWFVNIVVTKYDNAHEINLDASRRSVAATAGVDKSQAANRKIDGKSAIYAAKTTDSGTMLDAIYWLDADGGYGTKMAEITIASNKPGDITEDVLETLKIT